jgi:DNA-binding transcriptional MerR regulator
MINETKTKELFDLIDTLNDNNEKYIQYYIEIGKILSYIKDKKLYMHYASHVKDWIGLLKELNISYTDAKHLMDTHNFAVGKEDQISKLPLQRIKQLAQANISPEQTTEYIEKASYLPQKDWMDELRQLEGYKSYLECEHQETETFLRCLGCGKWIKQ